MLSLSLTHTHTHLHTLNFSLSPTHILFHSHSPFYLSFFLSFYLSIFFSLFLFFFFSFFFHSTHKNLFILLAVLSKIIRTDVRLGESQSLTISSEAAVSIMDSSGSQNITEGSSATGGGTRIPTGPRYLVLAQY